MQKTIKKSGSKLAALVRSPLFFWVVVAWFVVQAGWIALSSRYPMAFDEGTHLGLIQLYAHQWSPLLLHQPDGAAPFGSVVHNPSYLFYWLLSFPYRWLHAAFDMQTTVVWLRFINIGFFAGGLLLFRRVLLRTKTTAGVVHLALLLFTLIPITTLQAGQINYDNLLFLLLAWNMLLLLQFREQLLKKKTCNTGKLLSLAGLSMLASLVQFAYLPILAATFVYLAFLWYRTRKTAIKLWRKNWRAITDFKKYSALALFVVALGLFVEMYGTNIGYYHNVTPQCGQVLSVERCQANGPWSRNYYYDQHPRPQTNHNPFVYTGGWISGMIQRSFFVVNGASGPAPYANKAPLPALLIGGVALFAIGLLLLVKHWRSIVGSDPALAILLFVSAAYAMSLWGKLYYDYVRLDRLVAVNGRYLLLVLVPLLAAIGSAYRQQLSRKFRGWLVLVTLVIFLQGGGFLSFIYFSNADWYWPDDTAIVRANHDMQTIVRPLMLNWP